MLPLTHRSHNSTPTLALKRHFKIFTLVTLQEQTASHWSQGAELHRSPNNAEPQTQETNPPQAHLAVLHLC